MYYLLMFIITFIFSFIAAWLELSTVVTFSVVFLVIVPVTFYLKFYPLLWTKDINKTEVHLKKNLKDPMSYLYYSLANKLDDDVDKAIEKILKKYKNKQKQALFKTIHALYKKDIDLAGNYVQEITPVQYRYYYEAGIAIEKKDIESTEDALSLITIPWMKHAVLCELERLKGNDNKAKEFANKAIDKTRGVQRYQLYKEYERSGLLN